MTEERFDPKATLARVETLLSEVRQQAQQLQRQQKELQGLTKQIGAELQSLTLRKAEREEAVRVLEANANGHTLADMREAYAALADANSRHYMMQTQLDTLRQREQWLASQQASIQGQVAAIDSVATELNLAAQEEATLAGRSAPAGLLLAQEDLARRLVSQREEQNQRLAQDLQDGPMQFLSNLVLQSEVSQRLLSRDVERARAEVQNLKATVVRSLGEARFFMTELHPPTLEEIGLRPTIRRYVADLAARVGREIAVNLPGQDARYPSEVETAVFRVAQESLRHALRCTRSGALKLTLTLDPACVSVSVLGPGPEGEDAEGATALDLAHLYAQAVGGRFAVRDSGGDVLQFDLEIPLSPRP